MNPCVQCFKGIYCKQEEGKNPYYIGKYSGKLHFEKLEEREDQQESEQNP